MADAKPDECPQGPVSQDLAIDNDLGATIMRHSHEGLWAVA